MEINNKLRNKKKIIYTVLYRLNEDDKIKTKFQDDLTVVLRRLKEDLNFIKILKHS